MIKRIPETGGERPAANREMISPERIQDFLEDLRNRGRGKSCIENYQRMLYALYEDLPQPWPEYPARVSGDKGTGEKAGADTVEAGGDNSSRPEKWINENTGPEWLVQMEKQGLSSRTIRARISAWNSFMKYLKRREWCLQYSRTEEEQQPELSRMEYLRLLAAAKRQKKERTYMLIKTMGTAGLRVQELPQLTVEAVNQGTLNVEGYNGKQNRFLELSPLLREELQQYTKRMGIRTGPIFITGSGKPLPRSAINISISLLCQDARVKTDKANPRCLRNMYESTQKDLRADIDSLVRQAYEQMLQREELTIGWEE